MEINQLSLLKTQRFLPLFITQFLGAFNDNVFRNALIILVTYRLADTADIDLHVLINFAYGLFILPFFLFSATAGQLADKYQKSRIITIIKFIEIMIMIVATFGFYLQSVSLLLLVLFALGTHSAFFGPLKYAILPDQLQRNELIAGNGLIEAGTYLAILVGTIIGSSLILFLQGKLIISTIILSAALIGWLSSQFIPQTRIHNPQLVVNYNIFTETNKLIQYSKQKHDIFLSILGISWSWVIGAVFLAQMPIVVKDFLHANEHIFTLFLTLFSIGIGIGSLLCNRLLKGKVHATYVPLGALGMTLFTLDFYFSATHIAASSSTTLIGLTQFLQTLNGCRMMVDLFFLSVCAGIYVVPLYAILQQRSQEEYRARVIASNNIINALFMVLASVITIMILKLGFSVLQLFLMLAILSGIVTIYICKLLPDMFVKSFFHWLLSLLYRVEVKGMENYDNAGKRVVIVANHTSFIDALLLATFLPDALTFAVDITTAKQWWIRLFLRLVDAFPLDPTKPMAIKSLIEFVRKDKRCVIFPEGRITITGALMKIYEGPGMVADKSDAKLLPVRIQGAQYTLFSRLRGKVRIRWMPKITITIFPPQVLDVSPDLKGRKRRQKIGFQLYDLMIETMFESSDYHKTLFTSLIDAKIMNGSRLEIVEDIERNPLNYQQFIMRSFLLGSIIAKNTQPGENVGILLPNAVSNAVTFFGLHAYSRVPTMLNYSTGVKNVVLACELANVKTIYTSHRFVDLAKLQDMITELSKAGKRLVYLEDLRSSISLWDKLKNTVLAWFPQFTYNFINSCHPHLLDPNNPAVILFTSGSEGTPKGVVLSHINVQANRFQLSACVDFTSNDRMFNALPIFHSLGLTVGMVLPLLSGIKIFFYPSPLHYRIIPELSYETNATILFGTDTFLAGYAKYAHPYDFYSLRYIFAGAEKIREETQTMWARKFGVRIFEGYGTTETSPVLATNTAMQNKMGTVGRLLPGINYRLKPVPGIESGGILTVYGPNIMKGYLLASKPGEIIAPEQGWYETGDVVTIDEAGFVTIQGRVKRFAKIAGEMVSLAMVEQQINSLWPEHQHAVMNMPDTKKGEHLVLLTTNPQATRDAIVEYFHANQLPDIAIPKKIVITDNMPLLGSGKIDYSGVKELII